MFADYVYEKSAAEYSDKMLLIDADGLEQTTKYSDSFLAHGFEVVMYRNDLDLRIRYEEKIRSASEKIAVIAAPDVYIPYDMQKCMKKYVVSLSELFPKLNAAAIKGYDCHTYDLICSAYKDNYDVLNTYDATKEFITKRTFSQKNVCFYLNDRLKNIISRAELCKDYREWFSIAEEKARIDTTAIKYDAEIDTSDINFLFRDYILEYYSKLSSVMNTHSPVLVSKAMEYMRDQSERFVIIVMDGMSEFDWMKLSESFKDINYQKTSAFAMIPTVTSVSRQCLLSNKFPIKLENPWGQSKEKQEFVKCALSMGFNDNQISYQRGYDADFGHVIRCGAVIINDIDDMVHGQKQGRMGMFSDVSILAKQGKLAEMTKRLVSKGFDVYITADHGNTPRQGMGKFMSSGVETETKSRCMVVLKEIADKDTIKEKYNMIDFPKTYLPKEFDYLICDVGTSLDAKGEDVMSHGGISIDECIVPFIKIKAVDNNG